MSRAEKDYERCKAVVIAAGDALRQSVEDYLETGDVLAFRRALVGIVNNLEELNGVTQFGGVANA